MRHLSSALYCYSTALLRRAFSSSSAALLCRFPFHHAGRKDVDVQRQQSEQEVPRAGRDVQEIQELPKTHQERQDQLQGTKAQLQHPRDNITSRCQSSGVCACVCVCVCV